MKLVVAGIDTEIGKTWCSAVLVEAFEADYWKPVQSGDLDQSDKLTVRRIVRNKVSHFHPEAYAFRHAVSPHNAAQMEGTEIKLEEIHPPASDRLMIIELAGGVMSPLSLDITNLDLIEHLGAPVVLVVKNYLGSINHTLMSLHVMKERNIPVKGIIINGDANPSSEAAYQQIGQTQVIGRISWNMKPDAAWLKKNAESMRNIETLFHHA